MLARVITKVLFNNCLILTLRIPILFVSEHYMLRYGESSLSRRQAFQLVCIRGLIACIVGACA